MPSLSNYVCVPCQKEMRMVAKGVIVEEHMADGGPYKIWAADLWECAICYHQCLLGFGDSPLAQHFEADYGKFQEKVQYHIDAQSITEEPDEDTLFHHQERRG